MAKRIAKALGRPAVTIALGGVWDEAQIRGLSIAFRSPEAGRIVKGLVEAGVRNPVFVLDEVDKVSRRSFGDPSAALLEVLDPQQNHAFHDCYADIPVDVCEVLFIATANRLETVDGPAAVARPDGGDPGAGVRRRGEAPHRAQAPAAAADRGRRPARRAPVDRPARGGVR